MKTIDISFNDDSMKLLTALLGKKITCIKCDPFYFSTSVYGIVGLNADNKWISFTNFVEVLDYYGGNEDVGVFKVQNSIEDDIHSYAGETMITIPINATVMSIDVVNENQRLFKSSEQIYDVWVTRGVIFKMSDGRELSLEKDVWLSEDIIVERGEALSEKYASLDDFSENWENEYSGIARREIITIK